MSQSIPVPFTSFCIYSISLSEGTPLYQLFYFTRINYVNLPNIADCSRRDHTNHYHGHGLLKIVLLLTHDHKTELIVSFFCKGNNSSNSNKGLPLKYSELKGIIIIMAQQQQQPKGDFMPKVDLEKDKKFLSQAQLDYMRLAQQQNAGKSSISTLTNFNFILKSFLTLSMLMNKNRNQSWTIMHIIYT
jgi:hypothetical protein